MESDLVWRLLNNSYSPMGTCLDARMPKQCGKFVLSSAEEAQLQQLIRAQSTPQEAWKAVLRRHRTVTIV
jgi:hypothetical protein